jgi:very-short-patch-repair endonuclease
MNTFLFIIFLLVAGLLAFVMVARKRSEQNSSGGFVDKPKARPPLTAREQAMYNRLVQTLPDLVVLPQVSFGALLTARTRAARSSFSRKIADFVVCDRSFKVVAVIELGDSKKNRTGTSQRDAERDALLIEAGYRVLRYPRVPDVGRVEADFDPSLASVSPMG